MSELEKDLRLKMLNLKDIQKELDTERLVSSKVYDEVNLLHVVFSPTCLKDTGPIFLQYCFFFFEVQMGQGQKL